MAKGFCLDCGAKISRLWKRCEPCRADFDGFSEPTEEQLQETIAQQLENLPPWWPAGDAIDADEEDAA
ncbi:hypothetical protein [Sphingomonas sp.]|uniref:hypothetical protein n=1 Tax=Sphingomonas sp. TaxID=28214 RepID=UPI0025F186ED|nr:hypothetical protein [Sphingomonas sp.]